MYIQLCSDEYRSRLVCKLQPGPQLGLPSAVHLVVASSVFKTEHHSYHLHYLHSVFVQSINIPSSSVSSGLSSCWLMCHSKSKEQLRACVQFLK